MKRFQNPKVIKTKSNEIFPRGGEVPERGSKREIKYESKEMQSLSVHHLCYFAIFDVDSDLRFEGQYIACTAGCTDPTV